MNKLDLCMEILMNIIGSIIIAIFNVIIAYAIIEIDGNIVIAIIITSIIATLSGFISINEINNAIKKYELSKEEI